MPSKASALVLKVENVYSNLKHPNLFFLQVLTSKACSEEGLEDVTALLLNLSHGPETTRETILKLLLKGAQELGSVVRQNILDLQKELQTLKAATPGTSLAATAQPSTEDESQDSSDLRHAKGALIDRYVVRM